MNRTFRFLGVMTKNLREGVSYFLPFTFPRHNGSSVENQTATHSRVKDVVSEPGRHPFSDQLSEMISSPKLLKEGSFLHGIGFRNSGEALAAEIYIKDFRTGPQAIRKAALERIQRLPRSVSVEILQRLARSEKDVVLQMEILDAMAALNDDGRLDKRFFKEYLKNENTILKLAAVRAFSKYRDDESLEILSGAAGDGEPEVRRRALYTLVVTYEDRISPLVLHALGDPDAAVRRMAVFACGILKIKQAVSSLISLLNDAEREVQQAANESLKKITAEDFGFNPNGAQNSKKEAIAAWRVWARDQHTSLGLKP